MLNKIDNISAGSDYKKASKTAGTGNYLNINFARRMDFHDSVDFSPSLKFVSQINWRLKDFKHVANEKLYLDFILSNIEFQITVSLADFSSMEVLDYLVIKEFEKNKIRKKIISNISSKVGKINYSQEPLIVNLSSLNLLFQRVQDSGIGGDITFKDQFVLENFVNDIINGIIKEFSMLNNQIFIFLDKLANFKIVSRDKDRTNSSDFLVIKKISVTNLE